MDFLQAISEQKLSDGEVSLYWMGQAGFIVKTAGGSYIGIDLYFSDLVEKNLGIAYKRIMPALIKPEDLEFDTLLISHDHPDHLDMDSLDILISSGTKVMASLEAAEKIRKAGVMKNGTLFSVKPGDCMKTDSLEIETVDADHGDLAYDAVGFILKWGRKKIYYAGDTGFSPRVLSRAIECSPDISILPINGEFGNLTSEEAVRLAELLGTKILIPCHFWTFPAHRGDPSKLLDAMIGKSFELKLLTQGEGIVFREEI